MLYPSLVELLQVRKSKIKQKSSIYTALQYIKMNRSIARKYIHVLLNTESNSSMSDENKQV